MRRIVEVSSDFDKGNTFVCERRASFEYNNLASNMRRLAIVRAYRLQKVIDATYSEQLPGPSIRWSMQVRAAVAQAVVAANAPEIFPDASRFEQCACRWTSALPLGLVAPLLRDLLPIKKVVKGRFEQLSKTAHGMS